VIVGVYPGSFDPLTIAHLAVAEIAVDHLGLDRLDLAISRFALGKEHLADDTVAYVHIRSKFNCFQCRVERAPE